MISHSLPTPFAAVRTTAEAVAEDQFDTGSVPHTCAHGWNPQPDCMSDVVTMS